MNYLLDTNICVHIMNGKVPNILKIISQKRGSHFFISSITEAELWFGTQNSSQPTENGVRLGKFLLPFNRIPFESDHAEEFGHLKIQLKKKGKTLGSYDLLIAAQALAMDAVLVTANEKEFAQIKGLRIENWLK